MTTKKCIEFVTLVITKRGAWLPVGMMNFFLTCILVYLLPTKMEGVERRGGHKGT